MDKAGRSPQTLPAGASSLGLRVMLASLSGLFLASLFCGWYFRDTGSQEEALPTLPLGIWLTTLLLGLVSAAIESGRRKGQAASSAGASRTGVQLSLAFGLAFLLAQGWNWMVLLEQETGAGVHPLYAFNFYLMTALHAAHILGDPVTALQKVRNLAHYWHFLAATWIAILLNLYAIRIPEPQDSFLGPLSLGIAGMLLLGVLVYQGIAIRILWRRGEKAFALFSLLLPVAFLHIWARGEELDTQKMALRWGVLQALLLVALMFTGTLYLGTFASNYEEIAY